MSQISGIHRLASEKVGQGPLLSNGAAVAEVQQTPKYGIELTSTEELDEVRNIFIAFVTCFFEASSAVLRIASDDSRIHRTTFCKKS
jgi:hypothetical protein